MTFYFLSLLFTLFPLFISHFSRSINIKEQSTKIRLTKIGNTPHLKVEQKTCSIVHEIPVELIPTRHWKSNDIPNISGVKVKILVGVFNSLNF